MFLLFSSFLSFCLYIITTVTFLFNKEKSGHQCPSKKGHEKGGSLGKGVGQRETTNYTFQPLLGCVLIIAVRFIKSSRRAREIKKVTSTMGGRTKEDLATQNQKYNITPDLNRGSPSLDALIITFLLAESNHSSEIFLNFSFYKRKKRRRRKAVRRSDF